MMENKNLFEVATRKQYRFPFKGSATVEDLWQLSLTNLDSVFKTLNAEAKKVEEESLLKTKSAKDEELLDKIEIVKHIVRVKLEEKEQRENAKKNKEMKQRLLEIKAKRADAALEKMTDEELEREIAKLEV